MEESRQEATQKASHLGINRTGIDMSPGDVEAMEESAQASTSSPAEGPERIREAYCREAGGVGSVAMPATLSGATRNVAAQPPILIDKLGERLAFERAGARLYELLIGKCEASELASQIPLERLREFHDQEAQHFALLSEVISSLGADPTSLTPSADAAGVLGQGILQVLADPRTSVEQCLEAILAAELVDQHGWETLIQLAEDAGLAELGKRFRQVLAEENLHLELMKDLETQVIRSQLGSRAG